MKVTRDHGCLHGLNWRLELAPGCTLERLRAGLGDGWIDRTVMPAVWHLEAVAGGHQLVVVPATGRLQLRVHYGVAREARLDTARAIARALGEAAGDDAFVFDAEEELDVEVGDSRRY